MITTGHHRMITTDIRRCAVTDTVEMLRRLTEYYETLEECLLWFESPQPLLGDKTPIELIAKGRTAELLRIWDNLDAGTYI